MNKTLANQMKILGNGLKQQGTRNLPNSQPNQKVNLVSTTPKKSDKENEKSTLTDTKPDTISNLKDNKMPLATEKTSNQLAKQAPRFTLRNKNTDNLKENQFKASEPAKKEYGKNIVEKDKSIDNVSQNLSQTVKILRFDDENVTKKLSNGADIINSQVLTESFHKLKKVEEGKNEEAKIEEGNKKYNTKNVNHGKITTGPFSTKIEEIKVEEAKIEEGNKKYNTKNVNYGKITTGPFSTKTVEEKGLKTPEMATFNKIDENNTKAKYSGNDPTTNQPSERLHRKTISEFSGPLVLNNAATERPSHNRTLLSPPQNVIFTKLIIRF